MKHPIAATIAFYVAASLAWCAVCEHGLPRLRLPKMPRVRLAWKWLNMPRFDTNWMGWAIAIVLAACLVVGWIQSGGRWE